MRFYCDEFLTRYYVLRDSFENLFHCKLLGVGFTAGQCLKLYFPGMICWVDNLQLHGSVQYPSTSVFISWYGRQLITIISDLVPSKKQISDIMATRLIDSSGNCLSVSVCPVSFVKFSNDSLP